MASVEIKNPVPGETPEQRISRCANNLIYAVLAAGHDIRETQQMSGVHIDIHAGHGNGDPRVMHVISGFEPYGKRVNCTLPRCPIKFADITAPSYTAAETEENTGEA